MSLLVRLGKVLQHSHVVASYYKPLAINSRYGAQISISKSYHQGNAEEQNLVNNSEESVRLLQDLSKERSYRKDTSILRKSNTQQYILDKAEKVFKNSSKQSVIVYNAMLKFYISNGYHVNVKTFLEDMEKEGVKPNFNTYKSLIAVHSANGDTDSAKQVMKTMKNLNMYCDLKTVFFLTYGCFVEGNLQTGTELINYLVDKNYICDENDTVLLCRALMNSGKLAFLENFQSSGLIQENVIHYHNFNSLLHSLLQSGNINEVENVIKLAKLSPKNQENILYFGALRMPNLCIPTLNQMLEAGFTVTNEMFVLVSSSSTENYDKLVEVSAEKKFENLSEVNTSEAILGVARKVWNSHFVTEKMKLDFMKKLPSDVDLNELIEKDLISLINHNDFKTNYFKSFTSIVKLYSSLGFEGFENLKSLSRLTFSDAYLHSCIENYLLKREGLSLDKRSTLFYFQMELENMKRGYFEGNNNSLGKRKALSKCGNKLIQSLVLSSLNNTDKNMLTKLYSKIPDSKLDIFSANALIHHYIRDGQKNLVSSMHEKAVYSEEAQSMHYIPKELLSEKSRDALKTHLSAIYGDEVAHFIIYFSCLSNNLIDQAAQMVTSELVLSSETELLDIVCNINHILNLPGKIEHFMAQCKSVEGSQTFLDSYIYELGSRGFMKSGATVCKSMFANNFVSDNTKRFMQRRVVGFWKFPLAPDNFYNINPLLTDYFTAKPSESVLILEKISLYDRLSFTPGLKSRLLEHVVHDDCSLYEKAESLLKDHNKKEEELLNLAVISQRITTLFREGHSDEALGLWIKLSEYQEIKENFTSVHTICENIEKVVSKTKYLSILSRFVEESSKETKALHLVCSKKKALEFVITGVYNPIDLDNEFIKQTVNFIVEDRDAIGSFYDRLPNREQQAFCASQLIKANSPHVDVIEEKFMSSPDIYDLYAATMKNLIHFSRSVKELQFAFDFYKKVNAEERYLSAKKTIPQLVYKLQKMSENNRSEVSDLNELQSLLDELLLTYPLYLYGNLHASSVLEMYGRFNFGIEMQQKTTIETKERPRTTATMETKERPRTKNHKKQSENWSLDDVFELFGTAK